jgi:hypothetical protein
MLPNGYTRRFTGNLVRLLYDKLSYQRKDNGPPGLPQRAVAADAPARQSRVYMEMAPALSLHVSRRNDSPPDSQEHSADSQAIGEVIRSPSFPRKSLKVG